MDNDLKKAIQTVILDKELVPIPGNKWVELITNLSIGESFTCSMSGKSAAFQIARKNNIKLRSSQRGMERYRVRIWRVVEK